MDEEMKEILGELVYAIKCISHGRMEPGGLEMLGMCIEGPGKAGENNLSSAIIKAGDDISSSINNLADAIRVAAIKS